MKTLLLLATILFGSTLFAQQSNVEYNKKGDLTQGVFYYENGVVKQEGTYKNGKLHGQWISYDRLGKKNTMAFYHKGKKVGKWIYWKDNAIVEVDYEDNIINNVVEYKTEATYVSEE